jgi:hypothetical protein
MGEIRNACKILVRKPERRRSLWKIWWVFNIKMDLKEKGRDNADWIHLAHAWVQWWALLNTVMSLWVS